MSRRNSAVEMVLSDIADSNPENGFGEFVLVNMIQDGTQRWQVGQFLLSVEAPHRYEVSVCGQLFDSMTHHLH